MQKTDNRFVFDPSEIYNRIEMAFMAVAKPRVYILQFYSFQD